MEEDSVGDMGLEGDGVGVRGGDAGAGRDEVLCATIAPDAQTLVGHPSGPSDKLRMIPLNKRAIYATKRQLLSN